MFVYGFCVSSLFFWVWWSNLHSTISALFFSLTHLHLYILFYCWFIQRSSSLIPVCFIHDVLSSLFLFFGEGAEPCSFSKLCFPCYRYVFDQGLSFFGHTKRSCSPNQRQFIEVYCKTITPGVLNQF